MVAYNSQEKAELNHMVALCREYRFHETRRNIVQTAGLPLEAARLSIPELRRAVEAQIAAKKAPALAGEMLRIESTFRHVRDINNYNQQQTAVIISHLDRIFPYLNKQNLWHVSRKMEQIYHLSGQEHFYHKLNKQPKTTDKVRLLNRLIKDKKAPLPAPNYAETIKRKICDDGIKTINEELQQSKSDNEKIGLCEEKIYLIDNSGWSRSQRFLAKHQTYKALHALYARTGNENKAAQALKKENSFLSAYQKTQRFHPEFRARQAYEEWLCK